MRARLRRAAALSVLAVVGAAPPLAAQPAPPAPPPAGSADRDPELDRAVARALVARAAELAAAGAWWDARQLLVEALARVPAGPEAEQARRQLTAVDAALRPPPPPVTEAPPPPPVAEPAPPAVEAPPPVSPPAAASRSRSARWALALPAGLYGGAVGMALLDPRAASGGAAAGVVLGAGLGAGLGWYVAGRLQWDVRQARTVGSLGGWGTLLGGLLGDAASADLTPADGDDEDPAGIVVGASLGGAAGFAAGAWLARRGWFTADDVALVDGLATLALAGSLSLGAVMQPAETEAYSVNAVIGVGGALAVGAVMARTREVPARRVVHVGLWAAAGAAAPWAIYAVSADDTTDADERLAGVLSLAGMAGGAWYGWRRTRGWASTAARDAGRGDAPAALLSRDGDGAWRAGSPALRPARLPALGPALGHGVVADLVAGRF